MKDPFEFDASQASQPEEKVARKRGGKKAGSSNTASKRGASAKSKAKSKDKKQRELERERAALEKEKQREKKEGKHEKMERTRQKEKERAQAERKEKLEHSVNRLRKLSDQRPPQTSSISGVDVVQGSEADDYLNPAPPGKPGKEATATVLEETQQKQQTTGTKAWQPAAAISIPHVSERQGLGAASETQQQQNGSRSQAAAAIAQMPLLMLDQDEGDDDEAMPPADEEEQEHGQRQQKEKEKALNSNHPRQAKARSRRSLAGLEASQEEKDEEDEEAEAAVEAARDEERVLAVFGTKAQSAGLLIGGRKQQPKPGASDLGAVTSRSAPQQFASAALGEIPDRPLPSNGLIPMETDSKEDASNSNNNNANNRRHAASASMANNNPAEAIAPETPARKQQQPQQSVLVPDSPAVIQQTQPPAAQSTTVPMAVVSTASELQHQHLLQASELQVQGSHSHSAGREPSKHSKSSRKTGVALLEHLKPHKGDGARPSGAGISINLDLGDDSTSNAAGLVSLSAATAGPQGQQQPRPRTGAKRSLNSSVAKAAAVIPHAEPMQKDLAPEPEPADVDVGGDDMADDAPAPRAPVSRKERDGKDAKAASHSENAAAHDSSSRREKEKEREQEAKLKKDKEQQREHERKAERDRRKQQQQQQKDKERERLEKQQQEEQQLKKAQKEREKKEKEELQRQQEQQQQEQQEQDEQPPAKRARTNAYKPNPKATSSDDRSHLRDLLDTLVKKYVILGGELSGVVTSGSKKKGNESKGKVVQFKDIRNLRDLLKRFSFQDLSPFVDLHARLHPELQGEIDGLSFEDKLQLSLPGDHDNAKDLMSSLVRRWVLLGASTKSDKSLLDDIESCKTLSELFERRSLKELLPLMNIHATIFPELLTEAEGMPMEERMLL